MSPDTYITEFLHFTSGQSSRKVAYSRLGDFKAKNFFVCLPGLLETRDSFHLLLSLVEKYSDCCWLSIDYCGRGLSDPLPIGEHYTTSKYIEDVENLIEKLVIQQSKRNDKKIHIIGTSMGGILAMHVAKRNRIHLDNIILNDIGLYLQWNALLSLYQHINQSKEEINQLKVDQRAVEAVYKRSHFDLPYEIDLTGMRFENLLKDYTGHIVLMHNSQSPICPTSIANQSKSRIADLKVWTSENQGHPVQWDKILVSKLAHLTKIKLQPVEIIVKDPAISAFEVLQRISDTSLIAANILEVSKNAFIEQKTQNQKKWVSDLLNRLRFWKRTFS
jgi:pimeloyl-ACP methyl ester carboxylesterase